MNIQTLPKNQLKKNIPDLRTGQVIRVHEKIKEGEKERVQVFEGLVISVKHGKGLNGMFKVRKIGAGGIGVERTFPFHMPAIQKVEVLRQEKVRRSKLYYVRAQVGKKVKKRKTKLQNLIYNMGGEDIAEQESKKNENEKEEKSNAQTEENIKNDKEIQPSSGENTEQIKDKEQVEDVEDKKEEVVEDNAESSNNKEEVLSENKKEEK